MKRVSPWTVEDDGIRPAGPADRCFYCNQPKGSEHAEGCVIRKRTVVVRFSIDLVVDVPEDWETTTIEDHYNDGSWCGSNIAGDLIRTVERIGDNGCLCNELSAEFVREATGEDEKAHQLFADALPT